jgi:Polyketide cyclase / dehydrase and lipid transport
MNQASPIGEAGRGQRERNRARLALEAPSLKRHRYPAIEARIVASGDAIDKADRGAFHAAMITKLAVVLLLALPARETMKADYFAHNQLLIDTSCDTVWAKLIDAAHWADWYPNASNLKLQNGAVALGPGAVWQWMTFGQTFESKVLEFEPPARLGWYGYAPGAGADVPRRPAHLASRPRAAGSAGDDARLARGPARQRTLPSRSLRC